MPNGAETFTLPMGIALSGHAVEQWWHIGNGTLEPKTCRTNQLQHRPGSLEVANRVRLGGSGQPC